MMQIPLDIENWGGIISLNEHIFIYKLNLSMTAENQVDQCQTLEIHDEVTGIVKSQMSSSQLLFDLADLFKVLGNITRIRILHALNFSELCVCDLVEVLEMSQSAISHQLGILRASKIVKFRKEGKNVFYSLDDDHIRSLLSDGIIHIQEG